MDTFCRFNNPQAPAAAQALPPAQALGSFCFPLGPENLRPKEIMRPEVTATHWYCAVLEPTWLSAKQRSDHRVLQTFSYTLTGGDGSRLHGFCR